MLARAISLGLPPFEDQQANPSATGATSAHPLGKDNVTFILSLYGEAVAYVTAKGRIVTIFTVIVLNFT